MKALHLSDSFAIPADAVTQTFGVLAVRGAGKSNVAAVMAEEMYAAGLPFVAIDPVGAWWGLRASGNPKEPALPKIGLSIPIFGGFHGDVPLERSGAELVADTIVEERLSCVVDVSAFESESAKRQFLTAFAERLFRRKGQPGHEHPLHLFLEEADDYAPQRAMGPEQHRCLGAFQRIVKQGRSRGLGATMITQRSAALNKDLLTQLETLIVLRTTSPQDRKAIAGWVEYHGQARELLESLPSLETGEAWVWSPHWMKVVERVRFRRRRTFDSGATPKDAGGRRAATLADIDLGALKTRMAATIEKAKAEDPRELRRQVADLQAQLQKVAAAKPAPAAAAPKVREVWVLKNAHVSSLEKHADRLGRAVVALQSAAHDLEVQGKEILAALTAARAVKAGALPSARGSQDGAGALPAGRPGVVGSGSAGRVVPARSPVVPVGDPGKGETAILTAVAQHGATGVTREQLTIIAGYKRSTRDLYLQRLKAAGLVQQQGEDVVATDAGVSALGASFKPLPVGDALREHWVARLPEGERRLFVAVAGAYPRAVDRDALGEAAGYKRSTRDLYLQRLAARKLIRTDRGLVVAAQELFG